MLSLSAIVHGGTSRALLAACGASAHAIAGWLCVAAPLGLLIYLPLVRLLRRPALDPRLQAPIRRAMECD